MKHLLLALALPLCISVYAQSAFHLAIEDSAMNAYLQNRKPATLIIQIIDTSSAKRVDVKCTFVTFGARLQIARYYKTNAEGFIKIILDQNLPYQQVWLSVGDYFYAGVYVNTELKLTIDVRKLENKEGVSFFGKGIAFSGLDGELNTVLNKHVLYKKDLQDKLTSGLDELCAARRNFPAKSFFKRMDSIWRALNRIDSEFIGEYPNWAWAVTNETSSKVYGSICTAYWGDTMPNDWFIRMNMHKPYFTSNDGVLFYRYLCNYESIRRVGVESNIKGFDSIFPSPKSDILKLFLLEKWKDSFLLTYPVILSSMKTEWCEELVRNELREATARQLKIDSLLATTERIRDTAGFIGAPIGRFDFDAAMYKLDSIKDENDFIRNLRAKFRNKALIIDFWATWCAPCLQEMPISKRFQETNKDLPVVYVYICTTSASNVKIWQNTIADLQLPGTHIFMNEKIVEKLKSELNSAGSGFPTYVVLDVNGRLRPNAIESMQSLDRANLLKAIGL